MGWGGDVITDAVARGGARLVMSALLRVVRVAVRELTHRRVAHDIADANVSLSPQLCFELAAVPGPAPLGLLVACEVWPPPAVFAATLPSEGPPAVSLGHRWALRRSIYLWIIKIESSPASHPGSAIHLRSCAGKTPPSPPQLCWQNHGVPRATCPMQRRPACRPREQHVLRGWTLLKSVSCLHATVVHTSSGV